MKDVSSSKFFSRSEVEVNWKLHMLENLVRSEVKWSAKSGVILQGIIPKKLQIFLARGSGARDHTFAYFSDHIFLLHFTSKKLFKNPYYFLLHFLLHCCAPHIYRTYLKSGECQILILHHPLLNIPQKGYNIILRYASRQNHAWKNFSVFGWV